MDDDADPSELWLLVDPLRFFFHAVSKIDARADFPTSRLLARALLASAVFWLDNQTRYLPVRLGWQVWHGALFGPFLNLRFQLALVIVKSPNAIRLLRESRFASQV